LNHIVRSKHPFAKQEEPRDDIPDCRLQGQCSRKTDDGGERQSSGDGEGPEDDKKHGGGEEKAEE